MTTKKTEENVYATVHDKMVVKRSGTAVFSGLSTVYMPSSTKYCVRLRYNNFIDTIESWSLYSETRIGDKVQVRYIRRIDKNNKVVRQHLR